MVVVGAELISMANHNQPQAEHEGDDHHPRERRARPAPPAANEAERPLCRGSGNRGVGHLYGPRLYRSVTATFCRQGQVAGRSYIWSRRCWWNGALIQLPYPGPENLLLQSRLRQHFHELSVCSHVHRLRDQFSFAIVDKTLWYSFDVVQLVHFP